MGHSFYRQHYGHDGLGKLLDKCLRVRTSDPSSIEMCLLAAGKIDIYVNSWQRLYDVCPGGLIISEAGGKVLGSDFTELSCYDENEIPHIYASNPNLSLILRSLFSP